MRNLARQECQSDPCMNGGTCLDKYLDYECKCLEGWEGKMCEKDINECARFAGSDLGCQNGATCINKPGIYEWENFFLTIFQFSTIDHLLNNFGKFLRCVCPAGWYGLHCTRRSNDCSSGPQGELCGHGTCITQTTGSKGYTCICEQVMIWNLKKKKI